MSEDIVAVRNLVKSYGRGSKRMLAVDDVSFTVPEGAIVGLLGPNGAGKTSVIKGILGVVTPDSGEVTIRGINARRQPLRAYRHVSSVLEGSRNIYWRLTVRENMELFASLQGIDPRRRRSFHDELIERFDLRDKVHSTVNDLSRGMKQKVAIACAFARETDVLFLDEPTLGLDLQTSHTLRQTLKGLVRDHARTIVLSSHDMDVVQDLCARVIILNNGRIALDDLVENLVALFRAEAYRIHVAAVLPDSLREGLDDAYALREWETSERDTLITLDVQTGAQLYEVIDRLRELDAPILGITRADPDLAEVFLRVTGASSDAPSATGRHLPERMAAQ